ncbi:MAG TPA: hypothetical protein VEP73_07180, partial [Actinomycetota bacterium]|nr:hypothetical protein [Actinomycetota bacterium]
MQALSARPRLVRWAAPIGVVALLAGGIGLATRSEGAAPSLPPRTAEQLLADVGRAEPPGMSGTVVETARLGLPALPTQGGGDLSVAGLVTGSHTARVWYAGHDRFRLAVSGSLAETDVIRDGQDLWTYESAANRATHVLLPVDKAEKAPMATPAATPEQAARRVLDAVTPSTSVRVGRTSEVAGRAVYELVLAP